MLVRGEEVCVLATKIDRLSRNGTMVAKSFAGLARFQAS